MAGYTEVFGGTTIYPAQQSYLSITLSTDITLAWPIEQQVAGDVVADIIDLDPTVPGLNVNLPDARQVSNGYTALFNNVGANTVTIRDAAGGVIVSLTSGTVWQVYLRDNSTLAGLWRTFQYGASVSVTNAAALAGSGLKAITTTLNQSMPVFSTAATPYTVLDTDRAKVLQWTGGVGVFNLAAAGTVGSDWFCQVKNAGSGDLTLTPPAGTIDGSATKAIAPGVGAIVYTDGTNYFTIGATTSGGGGAFDFVSIDVAGSGNFDLSGANLNRVSYRFTGVLTGNRTIRVPGSIQQYWIDNSTTGAFSLFIKTVAQVAPGVEVLQGNRAILYCDGNNVVDADTGTFTPPLAVALGGTGATTAAAARTNLGSTATGDAVFTAASAAAGLAALGGAPTTRTLTAGLGLTGGGDLSADRTFDANTGAGLTISGDAIILDTTSPRNVDHTAVSILNGAGITGGGDLTASRTISQIAPIIFAFKSADTARNSTTTPTADPHLVLAMEANSTYSIEIFLRWGCTTTAAQGFQLAMRGPASAVMQMHADGFEGTGGAYNGLLTEASNFNFNPGNALPTYSVVSITGQVTTFGTAGNVEVRWAQVVSNANNTNLFAGSWIKIKKLS